MPRSRSAVSVVGGFAVVATIIAIVSQRPEANSSTAGQAPSGQSPLPEHERLRQREGVWDVTMEYTAAPGSKPVIATGVQTNRLMNGIWLISDLEAEMMGRPFRGHGVNGYDPARKLYVGIWIDSMRSYVTPVEGEYVDARTFRTRSQEQDPAGRMVPSTQITETLDANTERTTLTAQAGDGRTFTRMVITYRRQK